MTNEDNEEDYNEEQKNIIAQANTITIDWWQSMLSWAKAGNHLSLIERKMAANYIKKIGNGLYFKMIKPAEKAIALKEKAEMLGFTMKE